MPRRRKPSVKRLEPRQPDDVTYQPDLPRQVAALKLVYEAALRRKAEETKRQSA